MVNVVHISTHSNGGAGRAAYRLHQGLLKQPGFKSTFISAGNKTQKYEENHLQIIPKELKVYQKILNRLGFSVTNFHKNHNTLKRITGDPEFFSMPETDYDIECLDVIKNADIINLHWVANFINYPKFFKTLKDKPIVWTLHDMNPFLGGFHYKEDSVRLTSLHHIDSQFSKLKKRSIQLSNMLTIVAPSEWLLAEASQSNTFNETTTYKRIEYGIDLKIFTPTNKIAAKKKLGLDTDLPCIMAIAENLLNRRKGFDLLGKAVEKITLTNFQILTIGCNSFPFKGNFKLKELGVVEDDKILRLAYSAADVILIPSREDNLPNVLLEGFACGTPAISFRVGGMLDQIDRKINGIFADEIDECSLQTAIEKFLINPGQFSSSKIRDFALSKFALDQQAIKYTDLYNSILRTSKP